MMRPTPKPAIKSLGEEVIKRSEQLPDETEDCKSVYWSWLEIKSFINSHSEKIDEWFVQMMDRESKNNIR